MLKKKSYCDTKYQYIVDQASCIVSTYFMARHVKNYELLENINVSSNLVPIGVINFWYLFLIFKQYPYKLWPAKLGRNNNDIKTKTKGLTFNNSNSALMLYHLDYMKKQIMPLVDENYQTISCLTERYQTIKLRKCTTPEDLHPLVLRTNIAIDNLKLVYTLKIFEKRVHIINMQFFFEMFKLPIDMLIYRYKH